MSPESSTHSPVRFVKGVGPKIASLLAKLGVETIRDLIFFFPRDYVDRSDIKPIAKVESGESVIIKGVVTKLRVQRTKRGYTIIKAAIMDKTGVIHAVWFNQPYIQNVLKKGVSLLVSGKAQFNSYSAEMELPVRDYEVLDPGKDEIQKIIPKYPLTEGLYQKRLRNIIGNILPVFLPKIPDPIPSEIRKKYRLMDLSPAIGTLHFPDDLTSVKPAHDRLAFDDFFMLQLGMLLRRKFFREERSGIEFKTDGELIKKFIATLPFQLTRAQKKVFGEIEADMSSGRAMSRLIQGDVGSGKTIIAVMASLIAVESGFQAAIMVPTEILAQQHFSRIKDQLSLLGVNVGLMIHGIKPSEKKRTKEMLASGELHIVIGTHALIEEDVNFRKLGLVVIDEQHRFGVVQRETLIKKGENPSLLVMTATPIPRSLALTLYGDLDRSVIDELPPGRVPIQTIYVSEDKRARAYEFMRSEMKKGRQVFLVCPLIDESEKVDLKAARLTAEELQKKVFPEFRVGLLHGRLKPDEKEKIMGDFKSCKINLLVSTTVIEVGIDIPNASIMLIEHAERFGLSQLHQLRGRIGRGAEKSYCLLAADTQSEEGRRRIKAMLSTTDGFKIAEEDLKIRGPGDFYGVRQAGLPVFRIADIINDTEMLSLSRQAAIDLLRRDPILESEENAPLRKELKERLGSFLELGALN